MVPWDEEWKRNRLLMLREQWEDCQDCPLSSDRNTTVFGRGNPMSPIMLIGEAPGEQEDLEGLPFVGESGQLLSAMLDCLKIELDDFYVTNTVMCRPSDNRDPSKAEMAACYPRLRNEIYLVDPLLIVLVGKVAFSSMTLCRKSMESSHGIFFDVLIPGNTTFGGAPVPVRYDAVPIYHPAYILRVDSIDPKTNQWSENGVANKTLRDLESAVQAVQNLRMRYELTKR